MNALNDLKKESDVIQKLFKKILKANSDKNHLLLSTNKNNALRVREFSITK